VRRGSLEAHFTARSVVRPSRRTGPQPELRSRLPAHHANAGAEKAITDVKRVIATRDFALRNNFRTNQMLELVRARFNHEADEIVIARTLRDALEGGQNLGRQLACRDVGTNL
jgi:hypothetical protein